MKLKSGLIRFLVTLALFGICYTIALKFFSFEIHKFFMEIASSHAVVVLHVFGYPAELSNYAGVINCINMGNSPLLRVMDGCDGMDLIAMFFAFALAFPGPIKHKLWYVPLGLLLVHFFNVIRVAVLVILADYNMEVMEFNHKYTFIVLVYGFVFLLWFFWIKKFALPHAQAKVA